MYSYTRKIVLVIEKQIHEAPRLLCNKEITFIADQDFTDVMQFIHVVIQAFNQQHAWRNADYVFAVSYYYLSSTSKFKVAYMYFDIMLHPFNLLDTYTFYYVFQFCNKM